MSRRRASRAALAALLVLAFAAPVHAQVNGIILDMADDGIDLSQVASTSLVHGTPTTTYWTAPMTDDCFLMLDATTVRAAGYEIREAGALLDGLVMFRPDLSVSDPGGETTIVTDGWEMLGLFDTDGDGGIGAADAVFEHLWLFMDDDVDGKISTVHQELHRPPSALLRVSLSAGPPVSDPQGNLRRLGTWFEDGDIPHETQFVDLMEVLVPVRPTTWGAIKAGARR
jgi:hypothetical protein